MGQSTTSIFPPKNHIPKHEIWDKNGTVRYIYFQKKRYIKTKKKNKWNFFTRTFGGRFSLSSSSCKKKNIPKHKKWDKIFSLSHFLVFSRNTKKFLVKNI